MNEITHLTPEFGSRPEDITAFNEAIASIDGHNAQFSLGNMMARALLDHLDDSQRVQELVDAGASEDEAEQTVHFVGSEKLQLTEQEQMARSIIGVTNTPVLEASGLSLSPLRTTATMFSNKGEQSVGKVRLQITDGGSFSNFLLSVHPEDANEDFKVNTTNIVKGIITETSDSIAEGVDDRMALETLAYSKGIIAGLEHLGLGNEPAAYKLSKLYEHAQQGDIKEYVQACDIGILQEPGEPTFGPSRWQRDATPEFLATNWNRVLDVVKAAKANPRAAELFDQLAVSTQATLDYAKDDLDNIKAEGYGGKHYGEGFEKVFETVELELNLINSPDEETNHA